MNYKEMIEHILGNAKIYLKEYSKKKILTDVEKGILHGLWMDVDSIKNQLEIETINGHKEAKKLLDELNLDRLMKELENLFK